MTYILSASLKIDISDGPLLKESMVKFDRKSYYVHSQYDRHEYELFQLSFQWEPHGTMTGRLSVPHLAGTFALLSLNAVCYSIEKGKQGQAIVFQTRTPLLRKPSPTILIIFVFWLRMFISALFTHVLSMSCITTVSLNVKHLRFTTSPTWF